MLFNHILRYRSEPLPFGEAAWQPRAWEGFIDGFRSNHQARPISSEIIPEQKSCNNTMQHHLHRTQQHFISGLDSKPTSSTWRCENWGSKCRKCLTSQLVDWNWSLHLKHCLCYTTTCSLHYLDGKLTIHCESINQKSRQKNVCDIFSHLTSLVSPFHLSIILNNVILM